MDKKTFRAMCLKRLRSVRKYGHFAKDKKVTTKLEKLISVSAPKSILFYLPMDIEVDVSGLLRQVRRGSCKTDIYVPFIQGKSFKMVQYRLPLKRNKYKIFEPKDSNFILKNVDMIIVPVVGVDGNFKRIGFGKGMYDRFFETLPNKPLVVFVQRMICMTSSKITDAYDIQGDYYITPDEIYTIGRDYVNRDNFSRGRRCSRRCNRFFYSKKSAKINY